MGPTLRVTNTGTGVRIGAPEVSEKVARESAGKPDREVSQGGPSEGEDAAQSVGCC